MRKADDQPSVKVLIRADPIVHYTIKSTVNGHAGPVGRDYQRVLKELTQDSTPES